MPAMLIVAIILLAIVVGIIGFCIWIVRKWRKELRRKG